MNKLESGFLVILIAMLLYSRLFCAESFLFI